MQMAKWAQDRAVAIDAATGNLATCLDLLHAVAELHPGPQLADAAQRTQELITLSGECPWVHLQQQDRRCCSLHSVRMRVTSLNCKKGMSARACRRQHPSVACPSWRLPGALWTSGATLSCHGPALAGALHAWGASLLANAVSACCGAAYDSSPVAEGH